MWHDRPREGPRPRDRGQRAPEGDGDAPDGPEGSTYDRPRGHRGPFHGLRDRPNRSGGCRHLDAVRRFHRRWITKPLRCVNLCVLGRGTFGPYAFHMAWRFDPRLERLAQRSPLVGFIDGLRVGDAASISLGFGIAREVAE